MLSSLSVRASIRHFAHAAVACFVSCVFAVATWKLDRDVELEWAPHLVAPAAVIAALAFVYAMVRLMIGRGALGAEVLAFARLRELRQLLKLDEPPTPSAS